MAKIQISQINFSAPDFKNTISSKEKIVLKWLIDWIENSIKLEEIHYGDFLPEKSKLAKYLNVSVGTLQNAIRQAEDLGYFESRQSVGTVIRNPNSNEKFFEKTFSKKDKAVLLIKKYILENKLKTGTNLPSVKEISQLIGIGENTVRIALDTLVQSKILMHYTKNGNKSCWSYLNTVKENYSEFEDIGLIDIVAKKIKDYIVNNYKLGEKVPSNLTLSKMFNVSIRTVNEAVRLLGEQKIILSRRGRYGTIYLNNPQKIIKQREREEKSLFMSKGKTEKLQETYLYSWEKTLDALKKFIIRKHNTGDKIPSMRELSQILNVSTNTIKRAVSILCEEGYLITQRGKYGGVFILEMPQKESEAFTWLALNPDVVKIKQS